MVESVETTLDTSLIILPGSSLLISRIELRALSACESVRFNPNRQQFRSQKSREIFLAHPFIAAYQFTKGFVLFFLDPGRFDIITYAGLDNKQGFMNAFAAQDSGLIKKILNMMPPWLWAILITVLLFNIVKILCYGIFLAKVKGQLPAKILLTCGIIFIALATGPLGVSRYALPVVPLILIGGSFAFCKELFSAKKVY